MATKYGTNATKISNTPIPQLAQQGEMAGRLHVHYDEFVLSAAITSGDVIVMGGKLPANARIIEVLFDSPDLDSSTAAAVTYGWAASDDAVEAAQSAGFLSSMDVHTAGKAQAMSGLLCSNIPGKFKKFASAVQPQLAVTGTGDATSGTIRCAIYYIVD